MILKGLKVAAVGVTGMGLLGALVFGRDVVSYISCSANSVKTAVKDSVPIEFELILKTFEALGWTCTNKGKTLSREGSNPFWKLLLRGFVLR